MKTLLLIVSVCGLLLMASVSVADDAKTEAIKQDRKTIEGTWRIVGLEINGNKVAEENARKLHVVNEPDGAWALFSDGKMVAKGTNAFDPLAKPKTNDVTIETDGTKMVYPGIYELGDKSRKLCIAPPGKERPTEFASPDGREWILVEFEREAAK